MRLWFRDILANRENTAGGRETVKATLSWRFCESPINRGQSNPMSSTKAALPAEEFSQTLFNS